MAWIFGSNPNQATIFPKKKNHCLRNTYDIKICKLYHNIVKNWGREYPSFFEGFSNHNPFFYGPRKKRRPLPLFFTTTKKDNTFNPIFNMTTHYCQLCGKPYKKTTNNQRYCSQECSQEARRLKSRVYFSRWYTRNKRYVWSKKKGTGTLGPHRHETDESEYEAIQKELHRLRLRK